MKLIILLSLLITLASCGQSSSNQSSAQKLQDSDSHLETIATYKVLNFQRCSYVGSVNTEVIVINDKELRIGSHSSYGIHSFLEDLVSMSEPSYQDNCHDFYDFRVSGNIESEMFYGLPNPTIAQSVEVIQIVDYDNL